LVAISVTAFALISITIGLHHFLAASSDEPPSLRHNLELSNLSRQLVTLVLEERRFEKDSFINLQTLDVFNGYERQWDDRRMSFMALMSRVSKIKMSDQDRLAFEQINRDFQAYTRGYESVVEQIKSGVVQTTRQANEAIGPFKIAVHRIENNGNAIRERAELRLEKTL
jgi:hypothetical protein